MPVSDEEDIVRAICSDKFDGEQLSPSLFTGAGTSVSRLTVTSLDDHWQLFQQHVSRPPERRLELIGEINVGELQRLGRSFEANPTELTVEAKPEDWNPAHAEIPQKISRGLANRIIRNLIIHNKPDDDFNSNF